MEVGKHYIVVHYGWNDPALNFPIYEEILGEFIRNCPEISDWNNSVAEFINKKGEIYKFRRRPTHKFRQFVPYKQLMEKAYNRMNTILTDISLKEELILISCRPRRIMEI
jgi:hypothetical protein